MERTISSLLQDLNLRSIEELLCWDEHFLAKETGLTIEAIHDLQQEVASKFAATPLSGVDLLTHISETQSLYPIGYPKLEGILGGGLFTGEVVELIGRSASGKTQMALSMLAHVVQTNTCHAAMFAPNTTPLIKRLRELCPNHGALFARVHCAPVTDAWQLLRALDACAQSEEDIQLVVIDGASAILSPVVDGSDSGREQLQRVVDALHRTARLGSCAILVTNSSTVPPSSSSATSWGEHPPVPTERPSLGLVWATAAAVRLTLSTISSAEAGPTSPVKQAVLTKSCRAALGQRVVFRVVAQGPFVESDPG